MERKYVIGLDYGTLSGRAIIADCKDGTVLASAVKEYDHGVMSEYLPDGTELTGTGWALQNPKDYIDVLKIYYSRSSSTIGEFLQKIL